MQAKRRVHCWIVYGTESGAAPRPPRQASANPRRDVDPFIADLIAGLQAEVRQERRFQSTAARFIGRGRGCSLPLDERAEAEITWRDSPLYFTETDFDAWERRSGWSGQR